MIHAFQKRHIISKNLVHFSHFQCMQPMLPNILENPRCSPIDNNQLKSVLFGALRYHFPKTSTINLKKALRLSILMFSPIQRYSSVSSARILYTNILWTTITFWRQDKPRTPRAFVFCLKYGLEFPLHLWSKKKDDD